MDLAFFIAFSVSVTLWLCSVSKFMMEEADQLARKMIIECLQKTADAILKVSVANRNKKQCGSNTFSENKDHIKAVISNWK